MIRIGAWNLAHERNASPMVLKRQLDFIDAVGCDVWLLTEVPYTFRTVMGTESTVLSDAMDRTHKAYAAVWAKDGVEEEPAIHEAAAVARVGALRACSCLLPTPEIPVAEWPDENYDRAARLRMTVGRLQSGLAGGAGNLVWGGDWSHPFAAGDAQADREVVAEAIAALGLRHAIQDVPHIAVPEGWKVRAGSRVEAASEDDGRLSPHDVFVVEVEQ